tara:strand:+ start:539 stop:784 length:246 start_codon:yes stop_codon:yes gene_type:complete
MNDKDNIVFPPLGWDPKIDQSEEWREKRHIMRLFIIHKMIENMSEDEKIANIKSTLNTRYFYSPDETLITLFAKYGGKLDE